MSRREHIWRGLHVVGVWLGMWMLGVVHGQPPAVDSMLQVLDQSIEQYARYDSVKLAEIDALRRVLLQTPAQDLRTRYQLSERLFRAYEVFNYDSAFVYATQTRRIAQQLGEPEAIASARINFGTILISSGMYKEALDTLQAIERATLPRSLRAFYYGQLGRCYGEMAAYSDLPYFSTGYTQQANRYRDSALHLSEEGTFFHEFLKGFLQAERGDLDAGYAQMRSTLANPDLGLHERAIVHYLLGELCQQQQQPRQAQWHLAQAAVYDIRTATKENLALIELATLLFRQDDLRRASAYIQKANQDAVFYGARQRQIQIAAVLPFIEEQVVRTIEEQKQRLWTYVLGISLLLVFVVALALIIYRQVGKLKKARNLIEQSHQAQQAINQQLLEANRLKEDYTQRLEQSNAQLREANRIKEEYVGYLFSLDSQLFEKFQRIKGELDHYAHHNRWAEVRRVIRDFDLRQEKQTLLANFDATFMRLFPDFVQDFNSLLREDAQIERKEGQLLTPELRIFALIRLGISDHEKIAQILGYSVNTIYMYKTKARKRSFLPNEAFDDRLMTITRLGGEKE